MPISDSEFYHGAALLRLASLFEEGIKIRRRLDIGQGCYIVDDKIGMYIKYASQRMSPWRFTFQLAHKEALVELKRRYHATFVILVCKDSCLVVLDDTEVLGLLDDPSSSTWWIAVEKRPRSMCTVSGSRGLLPNRVPDSDFTRIVEKLGVVL